MEDSGKDLSEGEKTDVFLAYKTLLDLLSRGRSVSAKALAKNLEKPWSEILVNLRILSRAGLVCLNPDAEKILAVYPFSSEPTGHRVWIGKNRSDANCAIDALSIPLLLKRPAKIRSFCPVCDRKIALSVDPSGKEIRASPKDVVLFVPPLSSVENAKLSLCPRINFFCSKDHLLRWQSENGQAGESWTPEKAIRQIPERFGFFFQAARCVLDDPAGNVRTETCCGPSHP